MKSYIVEFIKENPQDWKQKLEDKKIRVKIDGNLAIFNYDIEANFFDPIVKEARGIIINLNSMRVCCWPFTKFFNVHEQYAREDLENFDWDNCLVEDKIDGSIVKLWYDKEVQGWRWSTNSCISVRDAKISGSQKSFWNIIKSAINYGKISFRSLNKNYTYIFELVSPEIQIVVRYRVSKLYHIGTRDNISGDEINAYIGIEQPQIYNIHSLQDCIKAANELNPGNTEVKKEGFVVVDNNFTRLKIKSPRYIQLHHIWNNGVLSKKNAYELLQDYDVHELDADCTILRLSVALRYYDYKIKELEYNVEKYIDYVRGLYEELNHDRKAVASVIKNHRYAAFGFVAIGNDYDTKKIMGNFNKTTILRFIPDYAEENVYE